jgi:hypothetical protein
MGKKRRKVPPLGTREIVRVLVFLEFVQVEGTKHLQYEHPVTKRKVSVSTKWDRDPVRVGSPLFRMILDGSGISRRDFEEAYWETR